MLCFPRGSRNPSFRTTTSNVHRTQRKPSQPHLHRGLLTPMPPTLQACYQLLFLLRYDPAILNMVNHTG